jgi:CHRD domain
MRHVRFALFVLVVFAAATASAQTFHAILRGANEVPPADPDGSGTAVISISGTTVFYDITVANIDAPIAQHIHVGPAGVNGPIVVNLPGAFVDGRLVGSTTTDAVTASAILANPGGYYVNVHTNAFPGGAVRGQLSATVGGSALSTAGLIALLATMAIAGMFALRKVI